MNQSLTNTTKPLTDIKVLTEALLPAAKSYISQAHRRFPYINNNENMCYLLHEGHITVHRTLDGLIMRSVQAPIILGLNNQLSKGAEEFYFTTESQTHFSILPASKAKEIITQQQLWGNLSILLAYMIQHMSAYSSNMVAHSAYEIVRYQLINLMSEPDEIRLAITAVQYIQSRTLFSRSGIMKLLAAMKTDGHIIINKGVLVRLIDIPLNTEKAVC